MSWERKHGTPAQVKNIAQALSVNKRPGARGSQLRYPSSGSPHHLSMEQTQVQWHCPLWDQCLQELGISLVPVVGWRCVGSPWGPRVLLSCLTLKCCGCGTGAVLQGGAATAAFSSSVWAPAPGVGNIRQLCRLKICFVCIR